ncbi:hypothetical protein D9J81_24750 [Escherichia coli]|nr:hypothetical protein [Escherichia coli]MDN1288545.1 hypothetical protein [Escherichia coli]MDN1784824.1 hypothetical protein [Escherichia coli]MHX86044.1 hypothetical protein [Escherichia coli]
MPNSSESGSHDNISKAPKKFSGLYLYYHFSALLCRLIYLNFINRISGCLQILCPRKMVWQEAAQLPGIYKMGSRFAGLRPVSIVTHMIFLCVAFHAAFAA